MRNEKMFLIDFSLFDAQAARRRATAASGATTATTTTGA